MDTRDILIQTAFDNDNDWYKVYETLKAKTFNPKIEKHEGNFLTILDTNYPEFLRQKHMPPFVLQYEGNIDLLNSKTRLGVVISRNDNDFKRVNDVLSHEKDNLVLVISSRKFVEQQLVFNDYKVICVLDKPISQFDTKLKNRILRNGGLIITENLLSPCDSVRAMRVVQLHSHIQNKAFVVSANKKSGSLVQIYQALADNQDIIVLPTDINSQFVNNKLIYEGAEIYTNETQFA